MFPGGGGGKGGGALLTNWLLGSTGNNGALTGRNGGGTKPRPAASHSSGREESGTVELPGSSLVSFLLDSIFEGTGPSTLSKEGIL